MGMALALPMSSCQKAALAAEITALSTQTQATSSSHWNFLLPSQIATHSKIKTHLTS
jgi:hypothetical protein